ncbi:MAG: DNA repair protein RadC [Elusimicrobia bacterium]|nr:DNA repair protein RadC [Elusimicrobiota bacterium]
MDEQNKETSPHEGHRSRIKKRFRDGGLDGFLDHEVLELLLTYVIHRRDTKPIAWALMKKYGSLSAVLDKNTDELCEVPGMGPEAALFLTFQRALIRRYFLDNMKGKNALKSPEDVVQYCRASLEGEKYENFEVIYLTTKNTVINSEKISIGTIDRASVSPRRIVENALKSRAAGLIFVHNHPSGSPNPSKDDIHLTDELGKAARTLGLTVHDHIIVGKSSYYSFRANGLIKPQEEK